MKKIYKLNNIHCADCARALEETINGFSGVTSASINFVTLKFELEIPDEKWDETFLKVQKLIHDFSRDVVLLPFDEERELNSKTKQIEFKLKGLACPNCAKEIEDALSKLKEVKEVKLNLIKGSLILEVDEGTEDKFLGRIISLVKNIEPSVVLKPIKTKDESKIKFNPKYLFYTLGLILGFLVVLSSYGIIKLPEAGYYSLLVVSALFLGYTTYISAIKLLFNKTVNENLLVTISVFGAIIVGEHMEGLMVIALYTLGKMLEAAAVNKSRKDIKALMNIRPEYATILTSNGETRIRPEDVKMGDVIVVKPGERLAVDGVIKSGQSYIDAKSLTGESVPVLKKVGDELLSGVVILDGRIEVEATKEYSNSTVTKILELIEKASEKKSKTETFIAKFSKYYTLIVIVLAIITGVITGLVLGNIKEAVYRGLLFLVVSCPCAFAISVPLSYFSGIGNASKKGVLIKGTNYLDVCARVSSVIFDKTGTLTTGNFKITGVDILEDAYSYDELLLLAAIGEYGSIHPVAKAIQKATEGKNVPRAEKLQEVAGEGVYFEYEGTEYFVGKTANLENQGTSVVIKKGNITLGIIHLEDTVKETSKESIQGLKGMGVKTIILSGDKKEVATKIGNLLMVDECAGEMLPQDKYNYIENQIKESNGKIMYVGDGINDAPSLALADVGVSMGINGSPASIEASDIVLVDDDPSKIKEAILTSKFTKKIVFQNIIFAAVVKSACLLLGAIGIANMIMAVFADVGVTILAILNSLRVLKYGINKKNRK